MTREEKVSESGIDLGFREGTAGGKTGPGN